jgi:translocator protein
MAHPIFFIASGCRSKGNTGMHWKRSITGLLLWIAVSLLAGVVGLFFSPGEWYQELRKPAWTPPRWVFGPVWTFLYIIMGMAAWRVWGHGGFRKRSLHLFLFFLQLLLNALWSWLFFGMKNPGAALVDLALLWVILGIMLPLFWKVEGMAGKLLVPYFAWVTFALALNFEIWRLN